MEEITLKVEREAMRTSSSSVADDAGLPDLMPLPRPSPSLSHANQFPALFSLQSCAIEIGGAASSVRGRR